ncbi:LOW QUALITY PROTEIN: hypothetical protein U0070_021105, partial [Myodes glareolus]
MSTKRTRETTSTPEISLETEPIELVETGKSQEYWTVMRNTGDEIVDLTCESLEPVVVDLTHNDSVVKGEGQEEMGGGYAKIMLTAVCDDEELSRDRDVYVTTHTPRSARDEGATGLRPSGTVSCPICMDGYSEIVQNGRLIVSTECGHVFCSQCLRDSLKNANTCPTCRKKINHKRLMLSSGILPGQLSIFAPGYSEMGVGEKESGTLEFEYCGSSLFMELTCWPRSFPVGKVCPNSSGYRTFPSDLARHSPSNPRIPVQKPALKSPAGGLLFFFGEQSNPEDVALLVSSAQCCLWEQCPSHPISVHQLFSGTLPMLQSSLPGTEHSRPIDISKAVLLANWASILWTFDCFDGFDQQSMVPLPPLRQGLSQSRFNVGNPEEMSPTLKMHNITEKVPTGRQIASTCFSGSDHCISHLAVSRCLYERFHQQK